MKQEAKQTVLKENFEFMNAEITHLSESVEKESNSLEGCNYILTKLVKPLSNLEALRHYVQHKKNEFTINSSANNLKIVHSSGKTIVPDQLLSIPQVAKMLGCSRPTVYNKHMQNGLKVIYPTGKRGYKKVKESDFNVYMSKLGEPA